MTTANEVADIAGSRTTFRLVEYTKQVPLRAKRQDRNGSGLPTINKIALGVGIEIGLPAAIASCLVILQVIRRNDDRNGHYFDSQGISSNHLRSPVTELNTIRRRSTENGSTERNAKYSWTTGLTIGITHVCFVANGNVGEVHKVNYYQT